MRNRVGVYTYRAATHQTYDAISCTGKEGEDNNLHCPLRRRWVPEAQLVWVVTLQGSQPRWEGVFLKLLFLKIRNL